MKLLLLLSCFLCTAVANAKNFYISATGADTNTGLTITSPWKSISKINSSAYISGDSILFKCGDTFYGTLTPTTNGVNFSSYGTGAKPIITGLTTVSSWTSLGGNIWEAVLPGGLATLNMVVINGVLTPMGRYPNANTANGGYNTYESYVNNASITDNQLAASPNFTGADLVVRKVDFATARTTITSHSGTKINFTIPAGSSFTTGYGYFFENSLATLDQNGEWFYDVATRKIKIFYTSYPPAIQAATLTNLVSMLNSPGYVRSQVSFNGIAFKGSEDIMMNLSYCDNMTIDNCDFSFAGVNVIEHRNMNAFKIQNSNFIDVNMIGIQESNPGSGNNIAIQYNSIRRVGIYPGMISKNTKYHEGSSSTGINIGAANILIKQNTIDSIGYCGIALVKTKNGQIIRKNKISNFCFIKNDGGGIYNSGMRGDALPTINPIIDSNIVFKTLNAGNGTTKANNPHARGIYLDASSSNINILNNTVFSCYEGIYISQAQNIIIRGNTVYDGGSYIPANNTFSSQMSILDGNDGYQHTRKNKITKNIFFSKYSYQLPYYQHDRYNGVDSIGIIDSNYYANPTNSFPGFITNTTTSSVIDLYSFGQWRAAHPKYDANSKPSPVTIPQFTSVLIGSNKSPNETFASNVTSTSGYSSPVVHTLTWDGSSQISGTGSVKITCNVTSRNFTQLFQIIGAIDASKKYVLRFKTKGAKPGSFQTYLQQWTGAYSILTSVQTGSVGVGVEQHEIEFSGQHSTQTNAAVFIQFAQNSSTIYIDDIQFYEATTTPTNIDNYLRFEYNASNTAKTIALDAKYISVDSTVYNGSITLQPYTSAVLIKSGSITTLTALKAIAGSDVTLVLPVNSTTLKGSANTTVTSYSWTKIAGPTQCTIANATSASTLISNLVTGHYYFQLKVMNSAGQAAFDTLRIVASTMLPAKLSMFGAVNTDHKIVLQWESVAEDNFNYYQVERSEDGKTFNNIGKLNTSKTNDATKNYSFADNTPLNGVNFYRLSMVDFDGSTTYSKTISAADKNELSFSLKTLMISAKSSAIKMEINSKDARVINVVVADVNGRILFTNPIQLQNGQNIISKQLPSINTGVYFVKLFSNNAVISKSVFSTQ